MKSIWTALYVLCALFVCHTSVCAQPNEPTQAKQTGEKATPTTAVVGQPAPDFTLTGTDGSQTTLSDHRGVVVVLEWFNPDCPFVKLAHFQGKLGKRGAEFEKNGVKWLAINSGGDGKQGHGIERNKKAVDEYGLQWPVFLDPKGTVGRMYSATRTPHIFVIDPKGILVYAGALDDSRGAGYEASPKTDYLALAIESARKGEAAKQAKTKAWGCSVKYAPLEK